MKLNKKWSKKDKQAFADKNILKAQRVENKKKTNSRWACRKNRKSFLQHAFDRSKNNETSNEFNNRNHIS